MRFVEGQLISQRYRVESLIGTGSGGEVYKVWDEKRSTYLALKLLKPVWSDNPELLASFEDEARSLSKLKHQNIVRFYKMVREDDLAFFLMDFIQGVTLRKLLKEERQALSLPKILSIMTPICRALNYAHHEQVIHCDVKPENILIDQNETVFLTDFGIARSSKTGSDILRSAGTPAYMAPEQIQKTGVTPQTDIYALGAILYEMFTGRKPFSGETAPSQYSLPERIRWEQQNKVPISPDKVKEFYGFNPSKIIMKCLEKAPNRRYASTLDLLDDLERLRIDDAETNIQEAVPKKDDDNRIKRKNKALLPILAGIALIIVVLGIALASGGPAASLPTASSFSAQYNTCMNVDLGLQDQSMLIECVTSVNVNSNGTFQVYFRWELISSSPTVGVSIQADTNNYNMYILDDLGNRLDHIDTGGGTNQAVTLKAGETKEGWFLFPALPTDANGFYFVDEDNQVRTELLTRKW